MNTPALDASLASRKAFGLRLAAARKAVGLTQAQLGEGLGTNGHDLQKAAVSAWEVGTSSPSAAQLEMLCRRLNVSADYLLGTQAESSPIPTN